MILRRWWLVAGLAVAAAAGGEAGLTPEAKRKKIRLRSSKQLRQLLREAEVRARDD